MLIRQFAFPEVYDDGLDRLIIADHDRLLRNEWQRVNHAFISRGIDWRGDFLEDWLRGATDEEVLTLVIELLDADRSVTWTGYRICGTVHRGNGQKVWSLSLFLKHPDTQTKVSSKSF